MSVHKLDEVESKAAADKLFADLQKLVAQYKASDMVTEKVIGRVGIVGMAGGVTRTTVFGSVVFSAMYAPVVGISKETLIGLVSDLYDASESNPATPKAKEAYAKSNAEFQAKQANKTGNLEGFGDIGGALISPASKLKH